MAPVSSWTPERLARLRALRAEGLTYAECARVFGLHRERIRQVCEEQKIPVPNRPGSWRPARRLSNDEMLELLREWARAHGRPPARPECNPDNGLPSFNTLRRRFGVAFNEVLVLAGLVTRGPGENVRRANQKPGRVGKGKWVAAIDPNKAKQITAAKMAHWQRWFIPLPPRRASYPDSTRRSA